MVWATLHHVTSAIAAAQMPREAGMRSLRYAVLVAIWASACASCGTTAPTLVINPLIAISPSVGRVGTIFTVTGTGFTPGGTATMHQLIPGIAEVTHQGDLPPASGTLHVDFTTAGRGVGTTELWFVDDATQKASNHVTYTLTAT